MVYSFYNSCFRNTQLENHSGQSQQLSNCERFGLFLKGAGIFIVTLGFGLGLGLISPTLRHNIAEWYHECRTGNRQVKVIGPSFTSSVSKSDSIGVQHLIGTPPPFPNNVNTLQFIKKLDGGTEPSLLKDELNGNYVKKTTYKAIGSDYLLSEYHTNKAYRVLGVNAPEVALYNATTGELIKEYQEKELSASGFQPVMLSRFVGKQDLKDYLGTLGWDTTLQGGMGRPPAGMPPRSFEDNHAASLKDIQDAAQKGFVADCLLANWDSIGLWYDNMRYDPMTKEIWRVDNGGSLDFRANGQRKENFGPIITEFNTLRDQKINIQSWVLFHTITDEEIVRQIDAILPKRAEFLATIPFHLQNIMGKRFDYLTTYKEKLEASSDNAIYPITVKAIDENFTENRSIADQRKAHSKAKKYLGEEIAKIGGEVSVISPLGSCPKVDEFTIKKDLNETIFTWENTNGVQHDIPKDGKLRDHVVLYGVASQFNACEATYRFTPQPGDAVNTYRGDPTQGPAAQLQFPHEQVEIINNSANLGFNGLCHVLDDTTKMAVQHGYLTPLNEETADAVIKQLQQNGDKMEFLCVGNVPPGEHNTEKVYEMLVAAPAFGAYATASTAKDKQKKEIEFLCALYGYRAQFQQVIKLAQLNTKKQVIFKPTAPGLGVFSNRVEIVAKGFYIAAKEHEAILRKYNVKVQLQVYKSEGPPKEMADKLGLNKGEYRIQSRN